ncbi:hypothetical protein [Teredinibacter purpureus]|uniref:hypothetical protein n=1 Tax=Teredinibacter purpureus TaxID=2731756 RepID=UPI0005F837CA|nr:hypothetical protein [Teredinibacter purpureus]
MSWRKDLKSQPKKGRYFPIRFGDAVRLLKEYGLEQFDGNRLAIRMENVDGEFENGRLLIDIMPEEDLAIYSLPEEIAVGISERATILAFRELAKVQKRINNFDSSKYSYYCAYLKGLSEIVLTRKDISKQKGKYRSESKFSNAFKAKKVSRDETVLSTINI